MTKSLFLVSAITLIGFKSQADIVFTDNFNSYTNGNLAGLTQNTAGQGPWKQDNTSAATPVQVNNGAAVVGSSGQDIYAALNSSIALNTGTTFYIGLDVDVTAAQSTGDYFLHFSSPAGTTTAFGERLYIKSSGVGFVFGYDGSSGGTVSYSSTTLSLNNTYRIVLAYTVVAGAANDTFALYVNPTDLSVEGNNTAYLTTGYVGTGAELTNVAAINLRQGSASAAPTETVDNLIVGTTFKDVAAAPEPSTIALATMGGIACLVAIRRKR